jgi:hypothetical protein
MRKISLGERLPTEIDIKLRNVVPPPNIYNLDIAGSASSGKYISSRYKYMFCHEGMPEKYCYLGEIQIIMKAIHRQWVLVQVHVRCLRYVDSITKEYSLDENKFKKTMKSFGSADRPTPEDKSKKIVPWPGKYEAFS